MIVFGLGKNLFIKSVFGHCVPLYALSGNPGLVQQKVAMKLLTGIDLGPARFPQIPMKPEHIKELEKDLREFKIHTFQK